MLWKSDLSAMSTLDLWAFSPLVLLHHYLVSKYLQSFLAGPLVGDKRHFYLGTIGIFHGIEPCQIDEISPKFYRSRYERWQFEHCWRHLIVFMVSANLSHEKLRNTEGKKLQIYSTPQVLFNIISSNSWHRTSREGESHYFAICSTVIEVIPIQFSRWLCTRNFIPVS